MQYGNTSKVPLQSVCRALLVLPRPVVRIPSPAAPRPRRAPSPSHPLHNSTRKESSSGRRLSVWVLFWGLYIMGIGGPTRTRYTLWLHAAGLGMATLAHTPADNMNGSVCVAPGHWICDTWTDLSASRPGTGSAAAPRCRGAHGKARPAAPGQVGCASGERVSLSEEESLSAHTSLAAIRVVGEASLHLALRMRPLKDAQECRSCAVDFAAWFSCSVPSISDDDTCHSRIVQAMSSAAERTRWDIAGHTRHQ